jgi:hypothetical protein
MTYFGGYLSSTHSYIYFLFKTHPSAPTQLRGLVNYNILENPTYSRALGVDAKFAKLHRHVASVHEAAAVDLPQLPKSFKVKALEEVKAEEIEKKLEKAEVKERKRRASLGIEDDDVEDRLSPSNGDVDFVQAMEARDRTDSTTRAAHVSKIYNSSDPDMGSTRDVAAQGSTRRARGASVEGAGKDRAGLNSVFNMNPAGVD